MFSNPYFGLVLSFAAYQVGLQIRKRWNIPLFNPLLIAIILCIVTLRLFDIPYENYERGGSYLVFLIAPATVGLVIPLIHNMDKLKKNWLPILAGLAAGVATALFSAFFLCRLFGIGRELTVSVLPQSVTTAIAVPVSAEYGGLVGITAVCVVLRGISGAVFGPSLLKACRVTDPVATGIALGTASHAIGTSRSIEMGETEGAMSGLAVAIAGLLTVLLLPVVLMLL
ncbi:MAG: LrgB family protein [Ndongobacter sp.]|nr:LrgB family protein [Ndongobacter sp.]